MVPETHVKLCMTEPDFPGNIFLPQKFGKWTQNGSKTVFWIYWKIYSLIFSEFCLKINFIFAVFFHKSHTWEKSGSWDMDQDALDQSDCSMFKLVVSLEHNDGKAWFFAYWCRFVEIKSWLKNIGVGLVKNGCGHSGLRTVKLAVSQEGINGVSWFLVRW